MENKPWEQILLDQPWRHHGERGTVEVEKKKNKRAVEVEVDEEEENVMMWESEEDQHNNTSNPSLLTTLFPPHIFHLPT